jgi:hypothetical protein
MRRFFICLLFTSTLILIKQLSKAQTGSGISLSAGLEMGFPTTIHNPNSDFDLDAGLNIKLELPVFSALHITVTTGVLSYQRVLVDIYPNNTFRPTFTYFPIKGGLRYYLPKSLKYLYIEGEAGEALISNSLATSSFIYSGGFGGIIPIGGKSSFDLSMRYESGYKTNTNSNFPANTIAVRFAYRYQFK